MVKKNKIGFLIYSIFLQLFLTSCNHSKGTHEVPYQKPNIIYILADDLGYGDLSFTGQSKFTTPNIDQLAKEGMFFTNHYAGSTVCAPSRSALMTGQHTGHTFIRGNKAAEPEGQYPLQSSIVTLPDHLKSAGYVTGAFGKWGLGFPASDGDPNNQGFDEFYGYNCQRMAHNYYPYYLWHNQNKIVLPENEGKNQGVYAPDDIHHKALAFLEKNKDTSFFMFYPSIVPHAELLAPEKYIAQFRGKFLPEKQFKGVDDGEKYKMGAYGSQQEAHAAYAALVHILDSQVGEIRKKLKTLGIEKNTILIFSSDNGPHKEGGADPEYFNSNGIYRGFKRDLYEGGIRVPMIVSWPEKIQENSETNHVSAFWDVLPTVCEIAQIAVPDHIDGISFLPELLGKNQKKHEYLYWEFHEKGGKQAVRFGDWKGIRLKTQNNPKAPIALYNLSEDIQESKNIAHLHPEIIDRMEKIMNEEHQYSAEFPFKYEAKNMK